ncbi:hypothetical protein VNO77_22222 [Canavalia gladiata]|uniref:F-box domain-containing protein n=1 Tax=Canavalia gladiata TaxID=3824 RepID=A0AAN9L366_CANGL
MVNNGGRNSEEWFLPHDVLINILKRVPVKSLIRFKCVSKNWANLLESPYLSEQQLQYSTHNNPFLLLQRIPLRSPPSPFPLHPSTFLISPDFSVHDIDFTAPAARIVGSCNGLFCLRHIDHTLSLFNPATRQIKEVPQTLIDVKTINYVGFGFSPLVNDYKIVRISFCEVEVEDGVVLLDDVRVNRVQVYSLTTGYWKDIDAVNLRSLCLVSNSVTSSVTANGAIFWQGIITSDPDSELVVSFDIGLEVFTLLKGPPHPPSLPFSYSNVLVVYHDKLAMFRLFIDDNFESCSIDLWVLEDTPTCTAAEESWIKMYSVRSPSRILYPLSIWRDEIVCREELCRDNRGLKTVLSIFNPYSKELKKLPSHRDEYCYVSFDYVESLVPVVNGHHEP